MRTGKPRSVCAALILALTTVLLGSCQPTEQRAMRTMCEEIAAQYPAATLQDVYKTCYQDFFGAEHLMRDTASARAYLRRELEQMADEEQGEGCMPLTEPTGFRHRFVRISLHAVREGRMTEDELLAAFIAAAGKDNAYADDWEAEWRRIEAVATEVQPAWRDEELQALLRQAAQNRQAVRHSEAFRNTYKPHYRIIRRK